MATTLSFKEKMSTYDRESLKNYAMQLDIPKVSKLRKSEIIDRIAEVFLSPENLFYRMAILDDEAMGIFNEACGSSFNAGRESFLRSDIACILNEMDIGNIDDRGFFTILSDIRDVYESKIAGAVFESYREKASWVWKCFRWAEYMYIFVPEEIMVKLINIKRGMCMTTEQVREMFSKFPQDRTEMCRLGSEYAMRHYAFSDGLRRGVLKEQGEKEFYIPTIDEVNEFFAYNAIISKKPYQDLLMFLRKSSKPEFIKPEEFLYELWFKVSTLGDPREVIGWFFSRSDFNGDGLVQKVLPLLMAAINATNVSYNRGYSAEDMRFLSRKPAPRPKLVAASSKAAAMLAEAIPEINRMGFDVDLESNAATVPVFGMPNGINGPMEMKHKKIYPNDPCPCGSGLKYKKCCGSDNGGKEIP